MTAVRTHFTWSIEHPRGVCPFCGEKTVLVIASKLWEVDEESARETVGDDEYEQLQDGLTIDDEIVGHFCNTCDRLTSLSLNTSP